MFSEDGLESARHASALLYDHSLETLSKMTADEVVQVFEGAKVSEVMPEAGLTMHNLAMKIRCFKTDHEALRIIPAGGFQVNHQKITNPSEVITQNIHVLPNNLTLVRVGKKNYHIVRWLA